MAPRATKLATTGASVDIRDAAPPAVGEVLTALSATKAKWAPAGLVAITATALTDSTTGTATSTLAAPAGVYNLMFAHKIAAGAGALDAVTGFVPGHKFKILSWEAITDVVGAGAGATRAYNMEIGAVDVGTTPSTLTLTLAGTDTIGERTAGTAVAGANTGSATDAISIEVPAAGTAFTAGNVTFIIRIQNMDTADAFASIAAKINTLISDLTT